VPGVAALGVVNILIVYPIADVFIGNNFPIVVMVISIRAVRMVPSGAATIGA